MALQVALQNNTFDGGRTLRPRVVHRRVVEYPELLQFMAMDTALSETDMRAVMARFEAMLIYFAADGMRVRTPFGSFAVHVKGMHRAGRREPEISADRAFLKFLPSRSIQEKIRRQLHIDTQPTVHRGAPAVYGVTDLEAKQELHVVTAGHIVGVTGMNLTFNAAGADEGVWFAPPETATGSFTIPKTAVRAELYTRTGSNHVHCRVPPSLFPGRYRILVSSRRYVRRPDKPPKVGAMPFLVEVVAGEGASRL